MLHLPTETEEYLRLLEGMAKWSALVEREEGIHQLINYTTVNLARLYWTALVVFNAGALQHCEYVALGTPEWVMVNLAYADGW